MNSFPVSISQLIAPPQYAVMITPAFFLGMLYASAWTHPNSKIISLGEVRLWFGEDKVGSAYLIGSRLMWHEFLPQ